MFFSYKDKQIQLLKWAVIIVFLLSLLPLFVVCVYDRPSADDFAYSHSLRQTVNRGEWSVSGLIREAAEVDMHYYQTWQGLYSSAFILALQPGIFGDRFYGIGALFLMLIIFISITCLIRTVFRIFFPGKKPFLLSLMVFTVFLQGMPGICEGIYWFNGAWNYSFFLAMVLFNIAFVLQAVRQEGRAARLYTAASVVLSFLISGGNHVTGFLNIMLLFLIGVFSVYKKKKWNTLLPIISAMTGYAIMYIAPGTAIRRSRLFPQSLPRILFFSAWGSYEFFCRWINVQWVCYVLLLLLGSMVCLQTVPVCKEKMKLNPLILLLLSWVLICGMCAVPYSVLGSYGAPRVENVIWFAFILLTTCNVIYAVLWLQPPAWGRGHDLQLSLVAFILVFGLCFFRDANSVKAVLELHSHKPQDFAAAYDERVRLASESNGERLLEVDQLPASELLNFSDITSDLGDFRNKGWKDYYGVMIRLKENNDVR